MPLRSRLLAVPALRERYLRYVNEITDESLAWSKLGPTVEAYRDLVAPLVKKDTRKLDSYEAFVAATRSSADGPDKKAEQMSLQKFAVERSKYLHSRP